MNHQPRVLTKREAYILRFFDKYIRETTDCFWDLAEKCIGMVPEEKKAELEETLFGPMNFDLWLSYELKETHDMYCDDDDDDYGDEDQNSTMSLINHWHDPEPECDHYAQFYVDRLPDDDSDHELPF